MAITADIKSGKLIITADMDGNTSSKSGKSTIVASTGGFVAVGDVKYSLNIIKMKK
jgi:hypothetical protein